jgi:hypothetical protein
MIKRRSLTQTWLGAVAAGLVLAGGGAWAQDAPQTVGIASSVVKDVKVSNARTPKPRKVALRQRMALADYVQTGRASQLQILLLDRTTFSVGSNAALRIDRFVYDPDGGRSTAATVAKGAFRFMSGRSDRRNRATIGTPAATIGIRGTMLDGVVGRDASDIARDEIREARDVRTDPDTATLVVLRGPGPGADPREATGSASVEAGGVTAELAGPTQAAFVPRAGAPPIGPFNLSANGIARLNDLIHPATVVPSGGGLLGGLLKVLPVVTGALINSGGGGGDPGGEMRSPNQPAPPGSNYPPRE